MAEDKTQADKNGSLATIGAVPLVLGALTFIALLSQVSFDESTDAGPVAWTLLALAVVVMIVGVVVSVIAFVRWLKGRNRL